MFHFYISWKVFFAIIYLKLNTGESKKITELELLTHLAHCYISIPPTNVKAFWRFQGV